MRIARECRGFELVTLSPGTPINASNATQDDYQPSAYEVTAFAQLKARPSCYRKLLNGNENANRKSDSETMRHLKPFVCERLRK